jgi:16S rRNA (guanine1207-N2)-methyltransferase
MDLTPWYSKTVTLDWQGRTFAFAVSQELFSSNAVDQGSLLLLKSLPWDDLRDIQHVVDFGCGYGPLGIVAAAALPAARLTFVDRDALALMFTGENLSRNLPGRAGSHEGTAGIDLHDPERSDLLLWNVPGKAGEQVVHGLCGQLPATLEPGGLAALVVVNPLAGAILDAIAALSQLMITRTERHTAHTVIHVRRDDAPAIPHSSCDAFASGVFDREERIIELGDRAYVFKPVYGLPEYDNPDYSSAVAIEMLDMIGSVERCAIYQPGQGHVALATLLLNGTREWTLGGRDLLALKATRRNLEINGADSSRIASSPTPDMCVPSHDPPIPLLVAMLDDQLTPARIRHLVAGLSSVVITDGQVLLAGRSTSVGRMLTAATKDGGFRAGKRLRRRGASAVLLRRR